MPIKGESYRLKDKRKAGLLEPKSAPAEKVWWVKSKSAIYIQSGS